MEQILEFFRPRIAICELGWHHSCDSCNLKLSSGCAENRFCQIGLHRTCLATFY